jgi:hypothetical protein
MRDQRLVIAPMALALSFVSLSFLTSHASAHLGHVILRAERYLKLDASDSDTRLVVSLTLGPEEGARILGAADTNDDQTVSAAESDAYLAQWGAGLVVDVPVEIDGVAQVPEWTEGYMEPIGPVAPSALTVEITAHLAVTGQEHVVRFRDHMRREVFERTDVAFRAHDGAELVVAGVGDAPVELTRDLAFGSGEAGAPDTFTARIRFPRHDAPTRVTPLALGALATLVGVGALVYVVRRRRTKG